MTNFGPAEALIKRMLGRVRQLTADETNQLVRTYQESGITTFSEAWSAALLETTGKYDLLYPLHIRRALATLNTGPTTDIFSQPTLPAGVDRETLHNARHIIYMALTAVQVHHLLSEAHYQRLVAPWEEAVDKINLPVEA